MNDREFWIKADIKPTGDCRKLLVWIVWPDSYFWTPPGPKICWWQSSPGYFSANKIENANHIVKYWAEIPTPTGGTEDENLYG